MGLGRGHYAATVCVRCRHALKRCYRIAPQQPTLAWSAIAQSRLDEPPGPIVFPNDGGNIAPPYSAYASPNCEWVNGAFSDSPSLPPVVCKKAYLKCSGS